MGCTVGRQQKVRPFCCLRLFAASFLRRDYMIDCPSCGNRIEDSTKHWCSHCGTKLHKESAQGLSGEEKAGICIGNICLSPLLGVILYYVWKGEKPKKPAMCVA